MNDQYEMAQLLKNCQYLSKMRIERFMMLLQQQKFL